MVSETPDHGFDMVRLVAMTTDDNEFLHAGSLPGKTGCAHLGAAELLSQRLLPRMLRQQLRRLVSHLQSCGGPSVACYAQDCASLPAQECRQRGRHEDGMNGHAHLALCRCHCRGSLLLQRRYNAAVLIPLRLRAKSRFSQRSLPL